MPESPLVRHERIDVVIAKPCQFFSENDGARDCHRSPLAGEERNALARVADEDDPTATPPRHLDLRDVVEIHVRFLDTLEQVRNERFEVAVDGSQLARWMAVVVDWSLCPMHEEGCDTSTSNRIERDLTIRSTQRDERIEFFVPGEISQGESGGVASEISNELSLVIECELTNTRVNTVRANENVDVFDPAVAETNGNVVFSLFGALDGAPETDIHATRHSTMQDGFELATHEVEMAVTEQSASKLRIWERQPFLSVGIDERESRNLLVDGFEARQHP